MIRNWMVCIALPAAGPLVMAQTAAKPFIGNWKVEWQTDKQTYTADMEVGETGGSWKTATMSRNNPCFGRKVPLKYNSATEDSLDITLMFSEVITGCNNASVKLKVDDKGVVSGKRSGYELQMKRE